MLERKTDAGTANRLAYIASLFPKLTETFVLREVAALEREGFTVSTFSIRSKPSGTMHEVAKRFLNTTHYASWFGLPHLIAFFSLLGKKPRGLLCAMVYALTEVLRHWSHPDEAVRILVCLPKMILFSEQMRKEGVRHIHAHFANIPTTVALFSARVLGIRFSFTAHAWDIFVAKNLPGLRKKIREAGFIVTISEFNKKVLEEYLEKKEDQNRIHVVYCGVDISEYVPLEQRDSYRMIAGGSLVEQKGLPVLVEAASILRKKSVECRIEIIGSGPQKLLLQKMIQERQVDNILTLVGDIPHEELMDSMARCAAVIIPCIRTANGFMDGIPLFLIEGQALEVPAISTGISGIPELIEDGVTGYLVKPQDPEGLANAIMNILDDPIGARLMGRNGRKRVMHRFDLQANMAKLISLYRSILASEKLSRE